MKPAVRLNRRRVLQLLVASSGLCVAGVVPMQLRWCGDRHRTLRVRLLDSLYHGESARAIGHRFLSRHPEEGNAAVLERHITESIPGGAMRLVAAKDEELRRCLATRVRQDFVEDRVVRIDGWILSSTEVRLCALAALPLNG
jgi:hypothetical protein